MILISEYGINIEIIGLFALLGIPYTFKFLWAPLLDICKIPLFTSALGHRKGTLAVINILMCLSIIIVGSINPSENIIPIMIAAIALSSLSASQDIIIDSMRIELLSEHEQAGGATMISSGYRIGMLITSAGALSLTSFLSWSTTYSIAAILCAILCFLIISLYPKQKEIRHKPLSITESFIQPFKELLKRPNIASIVLFIIFYKLSDAYSQSLLSIFLLDNDYTKLDIATVVKTFGVFATFAGLFIGGYIGEKLSLKRYLTIGLVIQMLSNFAYISIIYMEGSITALLIVISLENICGGISTAAFVSYISLLCNKQFTASQYSFLSALASFGRTTISASAGFVIAYTGWAFFFIITAVMSLPALFLINKSIKNSH
jgi:PAT family beta-lactamase induction signal transducer AmpG